MNENWTLWITSSIMRYFDANKGTLKIYFNTEEELITNEPQYLDIKIYGPKGRQLDSRTWNLNVLINTTVNVAKDASNMYNIHTIGGKIASLFKAIPVYNSSDVIIGCLRVTHTREEDGIIQEYVGKASPSTNMHRFVIEAMFEMELSI